MRLRSGAIVVGKYALAVLGAVGPCFLGWLESGDWRKVVSAVALAVVSIASLVIFILHDLAQQKRQDRDDFESQATALDSRKLQRVAAAFLERMDALEVEIRGNEVRIKESSDWKAAFLPYQTRIEEWRAVAGACWLAEVPNVPAITRWVLKEYPIAERAFIYEMERFAKCREKLKKIIETPERWVKKNRGHRGVALEPDA